MRVLLPMVSMLLIIDEAKPFPGNVRGTGTVSLVDTGDRKILVTCAHVFEKYKKLSRASKSIGIIILGAPGQLDHFRMAEFEVIDLERKHLDLVTIAPSRPVRLEDFGKKYYRGWPWPPRRAERGEQVAMIGFPGSTLMAIPGGMDIQPAYFQEFVGSANERYFLIFDEHDERDTVGICEGGHEIREPPHWGGMSGTAAFAYDPNIGDARLVGFLQEAGEGKRATFFVTHADFILPDGRFDHSRIPW